MQKKSVQLMGHQTSVSLEPVFWEALALIARHQNTSIRQLIMQVDTQPDRLPNLSAALRIFVLYHKDDFQLADLPS